MLSPITAFDGFRALADPLAQILNLQLPVGRGGGGRPSSPGRIQEEFGLFFFLQKFSFASFAVSAFLFVVCPKDRSPDLSFFKHLRGFMINFKSQSGIHIHPGALEEEKVTLNV